MHTHCFLINFIVSSDRAAIHLLYRDGVFRVVASGPSLGMFGARAVEGEEQDDPKNLGHRLWSLAVSLSRSRSSNTTVGAPDALRCRFFSGRVCQEQQRELFVIGIVKFKVLHFS